MVLLASFIIFRLNKKQEIAETLILNYIIYINKFSEIIELSDLKLKELDHKGVFEADDEVGFVFKGIKEIQSILNEFTTKNITE